MSTSPPALPTPQAPPARWQRRTECCGLALLFSEEHSDNVCQRCEQHYPWKDLIRVPVAPLPPVALPYAAVSASPGARGMEWKAPLWDAIHAFGNAPNSVARQLAVVAVEAAVERAMAIAIEETALAQRGKTT